MDYNEIIKRDGHIHTKYCPHGSDDPFEEYINNAVEKGIKEISFTEHMPLPDCFLEANEGSETCAMKKSDVKDYINDVTNLKKIYDGKIKINIGMEVDYLDGLEAETKNLLNNYGPYLQDGLLSVHFIKIDNKYYAVDGQDGFEGLYNYFGSVEKIYDAYYKTLLQAVKADLGEYKPKRIGHPNLVRIFNKLYPCDYKNYDLIEEIVQEVKKRDYELDLNTAGLRKPYCNEVYISGYLKELVHKYKIKIVFGSDSHIASDVGSDFEMKYVN